jgi:hypothetical protein
LKNGGNYCYQNALLQSLKEVYLLCPSEFKEEVPVINGVDESNTLGALFLNILRSLIEGDVREDVRTAFNQKFDRLYDRSTKLVPAFPVSTSQSSSISPSAPTSLLPQAKSKGCKNW